MNIPLFSDNTYLSIINALPIGILLVNSEGTIVIANTKAENIFGYGNNELTDCFINQLIPERYHQHHDKLRHEFINNPDLRAMSNGMVLPSITKNNREIQIEAGLVPFIDGNQKHTLVSIIETTNKILKIATYSDPLTGLPDRNSFISLSESLRNLAIRNHVRLTVMFIDLDNFKAVNDLHGHDIGDKTLCEVAEILKSNIRINDVTGRFGGDEFLICLYGIKDILDIKRIANNIIKKISAIRIINGKKIELSASIGSMSTSEPASKTLLEMINSSDKAMYKAKKSGKGIVFSEGS